MCKVVGYIRVSTDEQVKHGTGLEIQEQEIKEYAKANRFQLVQLFSDKGISGANDITKRKGLNDLLDYCKDNKVDKVVITKMDRLARDVYIQLWIEKELKIYGIEIVSINEDNLNGDDYMTKAMRQMVGVFAELEKNRIADRLERGRRTKAGKGNKASGNCPIGYKYEYKDNNKNPIVVIDSDKAQIVKDMFSMYMNGMSLQRIANALNDKNITTERGNQWSKQSIQVILRNDFYTGTVRFNDIVEQGKHEAIINKIIFGKVQSMLNKNNKHT
jgi:DNA invertase Pin-like site-specific DNA recombinase